MTAVSLCQNIYDVILGVAFCSTLYRFPSLDKGAKVFSVYVWSAVFCELVAYFFAKKYQTNMPVYGVDCLVEFALISLYFNCVIDVFKAKKIGYYVAGAGVCIGFVNLVFVQGFYALNSYYLVFEGVCIIGMALFSFFRLLLRYDNLRLPRYLHFWIATILIFFWSATFINWSLYGYFMVKYASLGWTIDVSTIIAGIITYSAISCVFIFYPKLQKTP